MNYELFIKILETNINAGAGMLYSTDILLLTGICSSVVTFTLSAILFMAVGCIYQCYHKQSMLKNGRSKTIDSQCEREDVEHQHLELKDNVAYCTARVIRNQ